MFNNKIELEVKKLYKLQELKKELMQSMFVQNNIDWHKKSIKKHRKTSKSIEKQKKVKKSKKKKNKAQKSIGYSLTYKSQVVKYSKMK